uniref:Uncharacterized protein n=1 Tax=Anguilla anguilla TaxID=7936 RepID=A0A0E9XXZ4_ANGAN
MSSRLPCPPGITDAGQRQRRSLVSAPAPHLRRTYRYWEQKLPSKSCSSSPGGWSRSQLSG